MCGWESCAKRRSGSDYPSSLYCCWQVSSPWLAATSHNEDAAVCPGAECAGETVLGNPSLLRAELNVTQFLAEDLDRLSTIDYSYLDESTIDAMIAKLTSHLLNPDAEKPYATEDVSEYDERLCSILSNGEFPQKGGEDVD